MRSAAGIAAARSGVGLAVGFAAHLYSDSPLSHGHICSPSPTKHLVLPEDEV